MNRFFLFAYALVAMAACSKNEVVEVEATADSEMINFSIYQSAVTKAEDVTTTTIQSEEVGVYGVLDDGALSSLVIPNTMLSYDSNEGWNSSASYYWPAVGSYDFYAYYPFSGTADVANLTETTNYVVATDLPISNTALEQVDILACKNTTVESGYQVELTLDHMLAKVDFRIGVRSEYTEGALEIEIRDFELSGIINEHSGLDLINNKLVLGSTTGVYKYNTGASPSLIMTPSDGNPTVVGTTLSDPGSLSAYYPTAPDANTVISYANLDASEDVEAFMLLPQTLGNTTVGESQSVTISYTVKQKGVYIVGTAAEAKELSFVIRNQAGSITDWVAGASYLYTLVFDYASLFNANPITFYADRDGWSENTDDLQADNITSEP